MGDWKPAIIFPNVAIGEPIEEGPALFAPVGDVRVEGLSRAHPKFRQFLSRFTDAFGRKVSTSLLLIRSDAAETFLSSAAISSFRDALALSVIPYSRAIWIKHDTGRGAYWSNTFATYPLMIDKDYKWIIGRTPAIVSIDDVNKFRGQSSAELPHLGLQLSDFDRPMLRELLNRWNSRFSATNPTWMERAIIRSLNMAYQAGHLPGGTDVTFYDLGRTIALWVSAFEILAHPGNGNSGLKQVYGLLDKIEWKHSDMKVPAYDSYMGRNRVREKKNIACWLYGELYHARNDFLHGNPVDSARLEICGSGRNLGTYAAPLYRMALTAFTSLSFPKPSPSMENPKAFGEHIAKHTAFLRYQRAIEDALLTAAKRETARNHQRQKGRKA